MAPQTTASRNGARAAGMASRSEPVDFAREYVNRLDEMAHDPSKDISGMPPNMGQYALPHVQTFQGMFGTYTRAYLQSDEAAKDSHENARSMRNDCGIMECVEHRQLAVAMLDWQLVPEDENSPKQAKLIEELTKIIRRIPQFVDYLFCCQHAIWYGRYGIQHRFGWETIGGQQRVMPKRRRANPGWLPINGDKLVFRYDDEWDDSLPDQVGILVGARFQSGRKKINERWDVEPTGRGLAYFLQDWEAETVLVHKHIIEDGPWEFGIDAGVIHGVGIRSRIYWDWFQKQEMLAFLMSYLERSAGGIEIWSYPAGDTNALAQAKTAAKERLADGRNVVFFPKPMGDQYGLYDVQVIEPGMAGIETLHSLLSDYFGHRIKRYVLGQVLTSEAEATGLGSGVSDLHLNTFMQIVKYDATKLEETITDQLIRVIKDWNFPEARDIHVRFQFSTESPDVEKKLEAIHSAWEMGAGIAEREVLDLVGARQPEATDRVLMNPAMQPGEMGGDPFGGADGDPNQPQGHESREEVADRLYREMQDSLQDVMGRGGDQFDQIDYDRDQFGDRDTTEKFRRDVNRRLWNRESKDRYASGRQKRMFTDGKQGLLFKEDDHPRDDSGKFTSGSGGGKKSNKKEPKGKKLIRFWSRR